MYCKERKIAGKYNWETPCIIRCSDFRNVKMQKSVSQVQVNVILCREGERKNSLMFFKAKSQNKFFFFHFDLYFFIEVQLIYNVVLVSGVQQSHSDIYTHIYSFQILFHHRLSQGVDYSSLCSMLVFLFYI